MNIPGLEQKPLSPAWLLAVLTAGLAGGAVDFAYASMMSMVRGHPAMRVWQTVATGWLGPAAMRDGAPSVLIGVATHFGIALCMAAVFALAAWRSPLLHQRPWLAGVIYGGALFLVMSYVVVPLRWPGAYPTWKGWPSVTDVLAHLGVGIAISLVLARAALASQADAR